MPGRPRFTPQQVITAILSARGIKAVAAQRLGCSRPTLDNYIDRYPTVRAAYEEARDILLDTAESAMLTMIDNNEWPAVRFALITLGKGRGYTERQEDPHGQPQTVFPDYEAQLKRAYGQDYEPPPGGIL